MRMLQTVWLKQELAMQIGTFNETKLSSSLVVIFKLCFSCKFNEFTVLSRMNNFSCVLGKIHCTKRRYT